MRAFGLDLSDQSLKLIELKREGSELRLANFYDAALEEGVIIKGRIVKEDVLVAAIRESLIRARKGKIKTRFAVACIPELESFVRVIKLPSLPEEELAQAVRFESEQHIPLSGEEVYLDWQKIGQEPEGNLEVLVAASPKKLVDSYVSVLAKANLIPMVVEIESAATVRSVIRSEDKLCYLVVDIGRARTSLIIYDQGTLQFTSSVEPFGGSFTEKISKDLNLNLEEAEKFKKLYGLIRQDKRQNKKVRESLLPVVLKLADEINIAKKFYEDHFPAGQKFSKIILCGGGAKLAGLVPELKIILKEEVMLANPWVNVINQKDKYLPEINRKDSKDSLGYTTAIGLALRGVEGI